MGTYTANYNLYMPTVGEQGWGDLMNGNLTTIDTTMKGLSNRITAVENEVNGALSCTSVTTSGTITSTGKITANGGIGTKALTATSISNSGNMTNTGTLTCTGKITANGGIDTKALTATSISNSGNMTNTGTLTSTGMIYANGGINADLSPCFGLNSESGKIGAIYLSYSPTIIDHTGTGTSVTYTYRCCSLIPLCSFNQNLTRFLFHLLVFNKTRD